MVSSDLSHSTRHDLDGLRRTIPLAHGPSLDLAHEGHRLLIQHLAEDNVLAIEPRGGNSRDEKLRPVGVGTGVGHRKLSGLGVLELEVLVSELLAVDRLASPAVTTSEITTLAHESLNHTVELRSLVVESLAELTHTLFTSAKGTEVLCGAGHHIGIQLHRHPSGTGAANRHIEEDLGIAAATKPEPRKLRGAPSALGQTQPLFNVETRRAQRERRQRGSSRLDADERHDQHR
mmetsp:Transcript_72417/g.117470  ORF Transcript_72417/g.117470 Transcript_72417/m.117470 type:complete len:233 (+) Transcript_72417:81-779(+)